MHDASTPNRPAAIPVAGPLSSPASSRCPMGLVMGSGDEFTQATVDLLRRRLAIAGLICLAPNMFFFVLNLVDPSSAPRWFGIGGLLFDLAVVVTVAVLSGILWGPGRLSLCSLRRIEVMLFGVQGAFFAWLQVRLVLQPEFLDWVRTDAPDTAPRQLLNIAMAVSGLRWFFLIVLYGVFVPNTLKRCTWFVASAAVVPVLLTVSLGLGDERLRPILLTPVLILGAIVSAAAAIAIAGSLRVHRLQSQAEQYRKLGQYRLHDRLGSGGMGEVYLGEHVLLRRPCAIKVIHAEHSRDGRQLERFEREVRAMANLTHWNTVEVFDYGRTPDGTFFYVMEYLPGMNLETLVQRNGPLPPARAVHLLRQVCLALREAHAVGLLHRDIKPSNIIACERGGVVDVAKLLDFGLVQDLALGKDAEKLTMQGTILGSPPYMSPEQSRGRGSLGPRSDIYSVGGVAYFLLTGQPPFQRETVMELLMAHANDSVVPPRQVRADIPEDLEAVVLRCLEKDAGKRYPDAESLERALAACTCAGGWTEEMAAEWWRSHGETVSVTPPSRPEDESTKAMSPLPV